MRFIILVLTFFLLVFQIEAAQTTILETLGKQRVRSVFLSAVAEAPKALEIRDLQIRVPANIPEELLRSIEETKITIPSSENEKSKFVVDRLRKGIIVFCEEYIEFRRIKEPQIQVILVEGRWIPDFMDWRKKNKDCGKLPCAIPPCCGDCDGCGKSKTAG